ncbi:uncharacterized protein LOC131605091 [Vicia villosa]|uniref:uncharacterized protein LOC131605091 n=1 Tax=Vicia villosa TaxID=3911 RepID=UPI00273B7AF1|nr:uncharacterized protein LOC131605091 [Vicia villosa]
MAGRGGRNDDVIAETLGMISGVLGGNANGAGIGSNRQLGEFQRNNPPLFKGTHDPDGAQKWLKEIKRIFRVIYCVENLKVRAELDADGVAITWANFRREFLRRYFPEYVRGRKEIEFLELKQGNMTVSEYASKFVELAKYYAHYNNDEARIFLKCIKFDNVLRDEIKQGIRYKRIRRFGDLVDCSRIFEEDNIKVKSAHSHELVDKRGKKPMDRVGHCRHECKIIEKKSFKCGKTGHISTNYREKTVTCYNCDEEGHICSQCIKPRKNQLGGKVFDLFGSETTPEDRLIKSISVEDLAMSARQVDEAVKDRVVVFMMFVSIEVKGKAESSELPLVCDFPEVFLEDVRDLPTKREMEFAIELIPGTRLGLILERLALGSE